MFSQPPDQPFAGGQRATRQPRRRRGGSLPRGRREPSQHVHLSSQPQTPSGDVRWTTCCRRPGLVRAAHVAAQPTTLNVAQEAPELVSANMSTVATSTNGVPIVVERAMWWPAPGFNWQEAHNSPGEIVTGPRWAVAEGESGGPNSKQTYLLIANTSTFARDRAQCSVFEKAPRRRSCSLPRGSRTTSSATAEVPDLASGATARVDRNAGAHQRRSVVERAMYSTPTASSGRPAPTRWRTRCPVAPASHRRHPIGDRQPLWLAVPFRGSEAKRGPAQPAAARGVCCASANS